MLDNVATLAYILVPLWLMYTHRRPHHNRLSMMCVSLHLVVVSVRRALQSMGVDVPFAWSPIHATTMSIAGIAVFYEAYRARVFRIRPKGESPKT